MNSRSILASLLCLLIGIASAVKADQLRGDSDGMQGAAVKSATVSDVSELTASANCQTGSLSQVPAASSRRPRTDLFISGVYPHLTTYGVYSQD